MGAAAFGCFCLGCGEGTQVLAGGGWHVGKDKTTSAMISRCHESKVAEIEAGIAVAGGRGIWAEHSGSADGPSDGILLAGTYNSVQFRGLPLLLGNASYM